ncbi:hypothetical protein KCTCHS21_18470 [Cohnella abietis]|uniref:HTH cro/C1-type domain-containing protein n=1 Tax=Cohnella abietis TaxID=2507935 RepID=A0A3T1D330_9BACL|nr:hypothetical protein KCTCHS21_18470 [Cohnella abietis]
MGDDPVRCRIPEHLQRIKKSQEWLAEKSSQSKQQLSDIINMRDGRVVSVRKGRKLALLLGCHIDDLYVWA